MTWRVLLIFVVGFFFSGCSESSPSVDEEHAANSGKQTEQATESAEVKDRLIFVPQDVLVEGELNVDVMELVVPARTQELAQRIQQSREENPEWWREHRKRAQPGEPLPYDPKFGISEEEYNNFIALPKQSTMQKKSTATLKVTVNEEGVYVLDGGEDLPNFTAIEFDWGLDEVRTPFGTLAQRSKILASETKDTPLGAWNGVQWTMHVFDEKEGTDHQVLLAIGKLADSGRCVLYLRKQDDNSGEQTGFAQVLIYELPTAK